MTRTAGPASKRLKLKDDSGSERSRSSRKTKGKMTRSNEKIGNLEMEEANRLAEKLTGYHFIELRLPHREEADAADSMKWISTFDEEDVVIQRKLCMACMQNPMDAYLKPHVRVSHPEMSSEDAEVMRRLSDVRYTRFCTNGVVTSRMVHDMFPLVPRTPLINFLASLGILFLRNGRVRRMKINFENSYKEADIRGISKKTATKIVKRFLREGLLFHDELLFSADLVTGSRMLDPSTQTTICCHICEKISNAKNFSRHVKVHPRDWSECSLEDLTELFKRITDVRTALYYAAQPVQHSKILEVCGKDNVDACQRLIEFLLDAGFVIDSGDSERSVRPSKIVVFDPDADEMPYLPEEEVEAESLTLEPPELVSESDSSSVSSRRSRSDSVTSDTSSTSSNSSSNSRITLRPSSSPSDELFPYCVISGIAEHVEVEHALFDLLEAMTDDSNYKVDQAQYGFLLGYTSYCLVVSNGCKQNVISRLTMGDYRKARLDEPSGLYYFSFSSKTQCTQKDTVEYVCADERIWRAMEIFEVARERRVREVGWSGMSEDSAPFFCSYVSPSAIVKDTNYPMSQFLRMCGIDWPCRSGAICSAAWSLVPKDTGKLSHHQYSITYFKFLREKERSQIQLIDNGGRLAAHPTYRKITAVTISKAVNKLAPHNKVRKPQKRYTTPERKGLPNRPRGGDHRSEEYCRRIGKEVMEKPPKGEPRRRGRPVREKVEEEIDEEPAELLEPSEFIEINAIPWVEETSPIPTTDGYRVEVSGDVVLTCL